MYEEYRPCVGILLINKERKVFVGQRADYSIDSWQMPQGGIHINESYKDAALRELLEETGIKSVHVIYISKRWLYYKIPEALNKTYKKFSGQKQRWVLMKFIGEDSEIDINYSLHPEFKSWSWQNLDYVINNVIYFKKEVYHKVADEFMPHIFIES
ncbi:RNA pyrophosphohydrolase [Neoehrlichia mikurensis]|uniref:RNA pyrophosphohydrolase n=1 Tax=Neoehrlichia mikurensis TaxID=89586 RepID=A0A9Q9BTR9_9RICK|nr:RNA pyrophosphohydrolase [Neoehrlichia mikurensis]QXK92188.1 RNA pyrophosphohydrolase [Neoehrlichia mikurensis]QXK92644.1 RNA pyrophosphohydrolase [Neoehrlichia mikurensis]QXK93881.1 RNA pyrophosphohydrolase [Neoehrlichia mikurensis]UTO55121.1 RNA pyrophosphohydrolase [Neoehrlichia mikurensis]UTO56041.1 RNA pyrophosphohydrolase [Neoehrlichia mikurensis]